MTNLFKQSGLVLVFTLIVFLPVEVSAFTFTIDDTADAVDQNPGDGICATNGAVCTLRAAVQEANAWPGADAIIFPNIQNTYILSINGINEDLSASGDLDITEDLTIHGAGKDLTGTELTTIDANAIDRVIDIHGATVTITGLSIVNGSTAQSGGGIQNNGTLTLQNVVISNNETTTLKGGGIFNSGTLSLERVTIHNNNGSIGGAIANNFGTVTINNSLIQLNNGFGGGGAIDNGNGVTTITNSTIDGNISGQIGGGITNFAGMSISNSVISNNTASQGGGGGIYNAGPDFSGNQLTVTNSTISGNFSNLGDGGGIHTRKTVTVEGTTISNNFASTGSGGIYVHTNGSATLKQSIIANQQSGGNDCAGSTNLITSIDYNLDSDNSCNLNQANDLNTKDPLLATLAAGKGGPTAVHEIPTASPATDTGNNTDCPTTDQRGVLRPQDGDGSTTAECDRGAYEREATGTIDLAVSITDSADPVLVGSTLTYMLAVTNQGPATANNISVVDTLPAGVTYVSASAGCSGTGPVTCTEASLTAGASKSFSINTTANAAGTQSSTVTANATETDINTANNTNIQETTEVDTNTDVAVSLAMGPKPSVLVGDNITYSLTVANTGNTARNVELIVDLGTGVNALTATTSQGSCSTSRPVKCNLGDMNSGSPANDVSVNITAVPAATGTITGTATVNFKGIDPTPANNLVTDSLIADIKADLDIAIRSSSDPAYKDADTDYTITVTNNGPSALSAIAVTTLFENVNVTYVDKASAKFTCLDDGNVTVTCTSKSGISLGASESNDILIRINPGTAGTLQVTSSAADPNITIDAIPADDDSPVVITSTINNLDVPLLQSNLSVSIRQTPAAPKLNKYLRYELLVSSFGAIYNGSMQVTFELDPAFSYTLFDKHAGCSAVVNRIVTCATSGGVLTNGPFVFPLTLLPTTTGTFTHKAHVTFIKGNDINPSDDDATILSQVNASTNNPPTITGSPATTVNEGDLYNFRPVVNDPDTGDLLIFSIINQPSWASFDDSNGQLSGIPGNTDAGITSGIVVSVSDGIETRSLASFDLTVLNANVIPTINGTPATTINEDSHYSFTPTASDPDAGDTLTFGIVNKPVWASFDTNTGELSGIPANNDVGTTTGIVISVTDGTGSSLLPAFDLAVINTNDVPTIGGTPATSVNENTSYSFTPMANDVDIGDTLTFSISNKPSWASFDVNTGRLTGTPADTDVGQTLNITITVTDGMSSTSLAVFTITVLNVPGSGGGAPFYLLAILLIGSGLRLRTTFFKRSAACPL
ncbi:MAG: putative Ig domain-containing protein [Gammaproteobacteria bacterium]